MRSLDYGADGRLRNAYLQSVTVYRCVNLHADAIAQAPFALYRETGQDRVPARSSTCFNLEPAPDRG
jgi:phage portal protein BeeE